MARPNGHWGDASLAEKEPLARGVVLALPVERATQLASLQKESQSILRALDAEARIGAEVTPADDFVLLIVEEATDVDALVLPEIKERAGIVIGVAGDAPACRVVITRARKLLRAQGAALGARELVFSPEDFGHLGLESDGLREKLEILLRTLVLDAERLRLRREGWEEPPARELV